MSYQALARKWRPRTFEQVIGQEHVVSALSNALNNQRVHHAFLFSGTRGVGKTTLARIFAKALNCERGVSATPCGQCNACQSVDRGNFIDLIEVDAASRTKVDDTRELLDNVQYTPTQGRCKIYLIDEVHMLSIHSFNALLKTLEEPPEHVKFLLATTDPQKLPTTILSRCIQFNLRSMEIGQLTRQLETILQAEQLSYDREALLVLSRSANGSVRDALSLLDQAIAFGDQKVKSEQVRAMLGMIDDHYIFQLFEQLNASQPRACLDTIAEMALRSVEFNTALDELLTLIHNISLFQVSPEAVEWKGIDSVRLNSLSESCEAETLQLYYQIGLMSKKDLPLAPDPRTGFEMAILRMIAFQPAREDGPRPSGAALSKRVAGDRGTARTMTPHETASVEVADRGEANDETMLSMQEGDMAGQSEVTQGRDGGIAGQPAVPPGGGKKWSLQGIAEREGWHDFVEHCGLNGLSKELLMHLVPRSVAQKTKTLDLSLATGNRFLLNRERISKIERYCREQLDLEVTFNVVTETEKAIRTETPSERKEREQRQRLASARQAFMHDPTVQALVDQFDAEIVSDSIRPPEA